MPDDLDHRHPGVDRRTLIKRAAAAGAVAWAAPAIVGSISSPAAALSGGTLGCSWTYVFFRKPNDATTYYTGISQALGSTCGTFASNNTSPNPVCSTCSGVDYSMANFTGGGAGSIGNLRFGSGCPAGSAATQSNAADCDPYIQVDFNGVTINAVGGATILAAFSHPGNCLVATCPGSTSPNNSIANVCGSC